MRNIIIRIAIRNGDITFLVTRSEYVRLYKNGARIIFAVEYPNEDIANIEIKSL